MTGKTNAYAAWSSDSLDGHFGPFQALLMVRCRNGKLDAILDSEGNSLGEKQNQSVVQRAFERESRGEITIKMKVDTTNRIGAMAGIFASQRRRFSLWSLAGRNRPDKGPLDAYSGSARLPPCALRHYLGNRTHAQVRPGFNRVSRVGTRDSVHHLSQAPPLTFGDATAA